MSPERWLAAAVRCLPADRAEWGAAMMAELDEVETAERWRFALGCTRVALFPPSKGGHGSMAKGILFTLALVAVAAFALWRPETGGAWLASAISLQTWTLLFSKVFLFDLLVLVGLTWSLVKRANGVQPFARIPVAVQQRGRLAVEVYFGLMNPVLYLTVITSGPGWRNTKPLGRGLDRCIRPRRVSWWQYGAGACTARRFGWNRRGLGRGCASCCGCRWCAWCCSV